MTVRVAASRAVGRVRLRSTSPKPPYRVPSMADVRAVPWNGYTYASLFAGAGGSSLGYRLAGFRCLYVNEFVPAAADVYAANAEPWTYVDRRDVRQVEAADVSQRLLDAWIAMPDHRGDPRELDLLDGSPPCRSFSTAGRRSRVWGVEKAYSEGIVQRDDDLFFEYARLLRELRPRCFVAENVSGLVKGVAKGYFKQIHAALVAAGYRVDARLLDAARLGVPQHRRRVIFVGVRADLDAVPAFPTPLPYVYTLRDALPELVDGTARYRPGGAAARERAIAVDEPAPTVGATGIGTGFASQVRIGVGRGRFHSLDEPAPTVQQHGNLHTRSELSVERLSRAVGAAWDATRLGESSDRYFSLVRPAPDQPSPTVTAIGGTSAAGVAHPYERRKFTIDELRRVCSFPADFRLTGTFAQQWERLGRAVPPLMMRAIATTIRDDVLRRLDA